MVYIVSSCRKRNYYVGVIDPVIIIDFEILFYRLFIYDKKRDHRWTMAVTLI